MGKEYGDYNEDSVRQWQEIAIRQRERDSIYWKTLAEYLKPGTVLEVGAACGQISKLLASLGFQVVASDYQPFFVEYMKSIGLEALVIDATDIAAATDRRFDNIIAQSLTTQMRRNAEIVQKTYRSIHAQLQPDGIFLSTCAMHPLPFVRGMKERRRLYYSHDENMKFINELRLFRVVDTFPYQLLPSSFYTRWNKRVLNYIDFEFARVLPFLAIRQVYVLQKLPADY